MKLEKTGVRASNYSVWHRLLGPEYFAVDVDFVEYRANRGIVALLAVTGECNDEFHILNSKKYIWARTELERKILAELSAKLGVSAYYVIHTRDLSLFHVHNLADLGIFQVMGSQKYAKFIKDL